MFLDTIPLSILTFKFNLRFLRRQCRLLLLWIPYFKHSTQSVNVIFSVGVLVSPGWSRGLCVQQI